MPCHSHIGAKKPTAIENLENENCSRERFVTLQTIESKDVSLGDLFANFFVVPNFQREYVWGTDEVRQLLEDVHAEYSDSDRNADSEYFIGTIVTYVGDDAVYQLIDGQQRMTTSYLVLCAIRDYMKGIQGGEIQALTPQIAATSVDRKGRDVFRYRVALQYEDSCGVLGTIAKAEGSRMLRTQLVRSETF